MQKIGNGLLIAATVFLCLGTSSTSVNRAPRAAGSIALSRVGTLLSGIRGLSSASQAVANADLGLGSLSTLSRLPGLDESDELATSLSSGLVARAFASRSNDRVDVKDFGAIGNQTADDTAAILAAIDSCPNVSTATPTMGGGLRGCFVHLPKGNYRVSATIRLPSGVVLVGDGMLSTQLFLSNGVNADVVQSVGFTAFTGSGKYTSYTSGVPSFFGLRDLSINGNSFNNTSGRGIAFYGGNYQLENVFVDYTAGDGVYTENGTGPDTYVETSVDAQPEARIANLHIWKARGYGYNDFGPTDKHIVSMFISNSGSDGAIFQAPTATTRSTVDADFIHSYGNAGAGIRVNTNIRGGHLTGESNAQEGVVFGSSAYAALVQKVEAYANDTGAAGTYWQVNIAGSGVTVDNAQVTVSKATDIGGISMTNGNSRVNDAFIQGAGVAKGIGVSIASENNAFSGHIDNFASGSIGVDLPNSKNMVTANVSSVSTGLRHANTTVFNDVRLATQVLSGGVAWTGAAWNYNEVVDIRDKNANLSRFSVGTGFVVNDVGPKFATVTTANLGAFGNQSHTQFCTDCVKPGELTGSGVLVYDSGDGRWISSSGVPIGNGGHARFTGQAGLTAAGTTQATALALTADTSVVTSAASGSGVLLSAYTSPGIRRQEVFNRGANALLVYPPSGAQIEANAANVSVSLAVGGHATFECVSATQCYQAP